MKTLSSNFLQSTPRRIVFKTGFCSLLVLKLQKLVPITHVIFSVQLCYIQLPAYRIYPGVPYWSDGQLCKLRHVKRFNLLAREIKNHTKLTTPNAAQLQQNMPKHSIKRHRRQLHSQSNDTGYSNFKPTGSRLTSCKIWCLPQHSLFNSTKIRKRAIINLNNLRMSDYHLHNKLKEVI